MFLSTGSRDLKVVPHRLEVPSILVAVAAPKSDIAEAISSRLLSLPTITFSGIAVRLRFPSGHIYSLSDARESNAHHIHHVGSFI
jgi:hypothetical protein